MSKKTILVIAAVLIVFVSQGLGQEKKTREQIDKEAKARWRAEEERKKNAKIQIVEMTECKDGACKNWQEVHFLDDTRNVRKRESLQVGSEIATEIEQIGNTKKANKVLREIRKDAEISSNYKFVLVMINKINRWLIKEKEDDKYIEDGYVTGRIRYFDESGNLLFDKSMPTGRSVEMEPLISENGEVVAVASWETINVTEGPTVVVFVFDKKGNKICEIPSDECPLPWNINSLEEISFNGKYIAISILNEERPIRFFNLSNKKYWDADKNYDVYKIFDEGVARLGDRNVRGNTIDIDLKQFIGD